MTDPDDYAQLCDMALEQCSRRTVRYVCECCGNEVDEDCCGQVVAITEGSDEN